jgi:hypothetical protein
MFVCGKGAASIAYLLFIYCWVLSVVSTTHAMHVVTVLPVCAPGTSHVV